MFKEKFIVPPSAYIVLLIHFFILMIALLLFVPDSLGTLGVLFLFVSILMFKGYFVISVNEAYSFTLFGKYQSSGRKEGFYWINPFFTKWKISLKMQTSKAKKEVIREQNGKKVTVLAIVTWKVASPVKAIFEVENLADFVTMQVDATLTDLSATILHDIINNKSEKAFVPDKSIVLHQMFQKRLKSKLEKIGVVILDVEVG